MRSPDFLFDFDVSTAKVSQRPGVPFLPVQEGSAKPTLVLDMDCTLIHAVLSGGKQWQLFKRPSVDKFLRDMAQLYEIVVFTANFQGYADAILDKLDPEGELISHRLYAQHCTPLGTTEIKDLSRLGRDLKKVVILDDLEGNYVRQPENGVLISAYTSCGDNEDDQQLDRAAGLLKRIAGAEDMREELKAIKMEDTELLQQLGGSVSKFAPPPPMPKFAPPPQMAKACANNGGLKARRPMYVVPQFDKN